MTEEQASPRPDRPARDFPFYDGRPVRLSPLGWTIVLTLTVAGYVALMMLPDLLPGRLGAWSAIGFFVALPLLGLRLAAGKHWTALFRRPTARDIWIGLAFAPLTLLVSGIVAFGMTRVGMTAGNPAAALVLELKGVDLVLFIASTAPQLLGEELVTMIPLLALLTLLNGPLRLPRRTALLAAWIGSAALFGALHLSTYQWHLGQVLLIIGAARLALSLPYLITKNLWSSTIAHIANDWIVFATVLGLTALKPP